MSYMFLRQVRGMTILYPFHFIPNFDFRFELGGFELGCFGLEVLVELEGLCFEPGEPDSPSGGYSSVGSRTFEQLVAPGNSLTPSPVLYRLRPLFWTSNWRITFSCAWVISCVSDAGTLFPITAKESHWPPGYKHVPAVHNKLGLSMPPLTNWVIGAGTGCGGVFWKAANELPVTRNNSPFPGMHVCTA